MDKDKRLDSIKMHGTTVKKNCIFCWLIIKNMLLCVCVCVCVCVCTGGANLTAKWMYGEDGAMEMLSQDLRTVPVNLPVP